MNGQRIVAAEVRRMASLLEDEIVRSGRTWRGVEEILGWKEGTLRASLLGERPIELAQVYEVLEVLEMEPAEFFRELFFGGLQH